MHLIFIRSIFTQLYAKICILSYRRGRHSFNVIIGTELFPTYIPNIAKHAQKRCADGNTAPLRNENGTSEERRQAVIENPHLVDWFFMQRVESFIKHWLYKTLDAKWHWYRFEYQARGSIHSRLESLSRAGEKSPAHFLVSSHRARALSTYDACPRTPDNNARANACKEILI